MKRRRKTERGMALLAALMGIALMTIIVMDLTASTMLGYRSAANQANELRADYLARSGVNIGLALLVQHTSQEIQTNQQVDGLSQAWAIPYGPIPVGGGFASVSIQDEDRKLNINQLINVQNGGQNPAFEPVLEKLFVLIGVSLDVIPAIIDWLDPDSIPDGPTGAEADFYMRLMPPYAPRNGPMPSIGDLRMIRGIDDPTFFKLRQYLTVYGNPQNPGALQPVNINTAPPEVIAAMDSNLADPSTIKEIMARRLEQPFTQADLNSLPGSTGSTGSSPDQGGAGVSGAFTVISQFFTIEGRGSYAGAREVVYATVLRQGPGPSQLLDWYED